MGLGGRKGVALVTTLLFIALLVAMVSALFLAVRTKLFQSQSYQNDTAALYLAELAVADAMRELELDETWTAGFTNKSYPGVEGRYTVTFNTSGAPFTNMESVNNFDGIHDETYRGPMSLLPGQCMLVATASVGTSTRTVEAIVSMGGGTPLAVDGPLVVSGQIKLTGKVDVDGVKTLATKLHIPTNIHSNLVDAASDLVFIDDTQSPSISGTVTIVSSQAGAVNTGSYTPAGGPPVLGSPPVAIAPIDITAKVSSKSGAAAVPGAVPVRLSIPSAGSPIAAYAGVTNLDHSSGPEFYSGTSLTVGSLKLNGAALYVDGDLDVAEGIEGTGSVWVTGKTTFRGSSNITTTSPDKVALYSKGDVTLTGFDGTFLLSQYALTDPNISNSLATISAGMSDVLTTLTTIHGTSDLGASNGFDDLPGPIVKGRSLLGSGYTGPVAPHEGAAGDLVYRDPGLASGGRHIHPATGNASLFSQPQTPERDFLIRRLFQLYEINYGGRDGDWIDSFGLSEAKAGRLGLGGVDAINDARYIEGIDLISRFYENFSLNHIGSSYFQGLVYTNGFFRSSNDITIVGAIVTDVSPAARASSNTTDANPDPGDVYMENGSRLLYVEDFFKARPTGTATTAPRVTLKLWCSR